MSASSIPWNQILSFARDSGVPINRERGIIREYLQTTFLSILYSLPQANKLVFVGGTSMRLLRDLPRFSEDLDFDNLGLNNEEVTSLVRETVKRWQQRNLEIELHEHVKQGKTYFELRFPKLLYDLKISTNPKEKVMIKVDSATVWRGQKPEIILFRKYGMVEYVPANPKDQVLVQKLTAYAQRKQLQPRDMYDVVWLYGQGAKIDREFMAANQIPDLLKRVKDRWEANKVTEVMERKLAPFLFVPGDERKLAWFGDIINRL